MPPSPLRPSTLSAAFIDADEFLLLTDGTPDLPTLLRGYEHHGGLAVNWRMFGAGGIQRKQPSTVEAYTKCYAKQVRGRRWGSTVGVGAGAGPRLHGV